MTTAANAAGNDDDRDDVPAPATAAKPVQAGLWSRRDFFGRLSWSGFGIVSLIGLLAGMRSAFPRVLFTPPQSFKAGLPTDFTIGEVSEKFKKEHRVWIIREPEGVFALFAKCTHLGCTPRWLMTEEKFKCPCHGSGFYKSGINFEGPARTLPGGARRRRPARRRHEREVPFRERRLDEAGGVPARLMTRRRTTTA
jgi:cytochrome b6-f complex iron-sulfur subunit